MELHEGGHSLINISSGALVCPRALPSEPSSHSFCSCSRAAACESQHQPPRVLLGRSESTREEEEEEEGWEVKKEKERPRISADRRLWDCRVASYDAATLLRRSESHLIH